MTRFDSGNQKVWPFVVDETHSPPPLSRDALWVIIRGMTVVEVCRLMLISRHYCETLRNHMPAYWQGITGNPAVLTYAQFMKAYWGELRPGMTGQKVSRVLRRASAELLTRVIADRHHSWWTFHDMVHRSHHPVHIYVDKPPRVITQEKELIDLVGAECYGDHVKRFRWAVVDRMRCPTHENTPPLRRVYVCDGTRLTMHEFRFLCDTREWKHSCSLGDWTITDAFRAYTRKLRELSIDDPFVCA